MTAAQLIYLGFLLVQKGFKAFVDAKTFDVNVPLEDIPIKDINDWEGLLEWAVKSTEVPSPKKPDFV